MIKTLDCTLRDGGHSNLWNFDDEYVFALLGKLKKYKVDYVEIGYRNFYDRENKGQYFYCTPEFLSKFYPKKGRLKLGIMTDTSRFCMKDFKDAQNDFCDFVRIATHPERIKDTLDIAKELYLRGYNIFIQLMEIPNVLESHYKILERWNDKNIIKSLYIADTYSTVLPEDLDKYFNKLHSIGYENISFHAHDKSGLALQNTLEAIKLGAQIIDFSHNGLGENLDADVFFESFLY